MKKKKKDLRSVVAVTQGTRIRVLKMTEKTNLGDPDELINRALDDLEDRIDRAREGAERSRLRGWTE